MILKHTLAVLFFSLWFQWSWHLAGWQAHSRTKGLWWWRSSIHLSIHPSIGQTVWLKPCPTSHWTAVSGWRCGCRQGGSRGALLGFRSATDAALHLPLTFLRCQKRGLKSDLEECHVTFFYGCEASEKTLINGWYWDLHSAGM